MPKIGDTVRFLDSVGGGKVVRIDGNILYVDEDGFETPVLARNCVVVDSGSFVPPTPMPFNKKKEAPAESESRPAAKSTPSPAPTLPPMVETEAGEKLNIVVAFEANDLTHLSHTTYDTYLVNDSNYWLFITLLTRGDDSRQWTLRHSAVIEPGIQEFIGEVLPEELPGISHIALQYVAFKKDKPFDAKDPAMVVHKLDTTKFFKLHCFHRNPYFDAPVIALDIVKDDAPAKAQPVTVSADELKAAMTEKQRSERPRRQVSKSSRRNDEPLVVDLHIDELLDTTAGMSTADILNYQIDKFREVMDANLRNHGMKIVFIHGKGEGVLRNALMKELTHRYKGHEYQDASFRQYGFGATQVTIR